MDICPKTNDWCVFCSICKGEQYCTVALKKKAIKDLEKCPIEQNNKNGGKKNSA
jgi:hypothetical protein